MIQFSDVALPTADGVLLSARWFRPPDPRQTIVMHGATAIPRSFYEPFAEWLAGHARAQVLTYDYRGCGRSRDAAQRPATMGDWMIRDQGAALAAGAGAAGDGPLDVLGHSLGGFGTPFHAEAARVRRIVAVASGPAYSALGSKLTKPEKRRPGGTGPSFNS